MIEIVKESGFCHGVKAAVHKTRELINTRNEKIYLYGDLVNNRQVMARFLSEGLIVTENAAEIPAGSVVIIRAHGVSREVYNKLEHAKIIDCTCVKVKKIHEIVAEKTGFRVIIVGKKKHPEVLGILGWCEDGVVVENEEELHAAVSGEKICVVGQTTCGKEWWDKAVSIIREKKPDALMVTSKNLPSGSCLIYDTLCDVTARRIDNAVQTAKKSDCMVVVGDKKSANSVELYEACKKVCANTYFVSSAEELSDAKITECMHIGIAGSASAPTESINEIHDFILFVKFLSDAKNEIETAGNEYLDDLAKTEKPFIQAAIHDFQNQHQNGKRIRGALIKLGAMLTHSKSNMKNISLAYEIFATAILIHDDIIDKSETRRGKKTIHASENDAHFGLSCAICIGDYGLFLANKILADSELPPEILVRVFKLFSEIQLKTLEGEIMDVSLPYFPKNPATEEYTRAVSDIYEYKTAWYTLIGPIQLGAICGGASDEFLKILHEITLPLGLAFQIKDDLLGIFANEKKLGKPALSDIIEKKQTTLYGFACKNATSKQLEILEKSYGNPVAIETDLEAVREIFTATGAKATAEKEIATLSQAALDSIEKLDDEHKPYLRGLVHYLFGRGK